MSQKIIECVPNISEGRNLKVVRRIVRAIKSIPKIKVLNTESDYDHNRTVITFIGTPASISKAIFCLVNEASKLIDLTKHVGVHPRIGAIDVIPLIPLKDVTTQECVKIARTLGEKIGKDLNFPVYLYEKAALLRSRKNLSNIRNLGFENLKLSINKDREYKPDFGPRILGKSGAVTLGVRDFLIAFNINLKSKDICIGQDIARRIRSKNGGLPGIKALAFYLESKGITQVSINVTDYKKTSLIKVFNTVKNLASEQEVNISYSEIIGLVPEKAVPKYPKRTLKLKKFSKNKVLEYHLKHFS